MSFTSRIPRPVLILGAFIAAILTGGRDACSQTRTASGDVILPARSQAWPDGSTTFPDSFPRKFRPPLSILFPPNAPPLGAVIGPRQRPLRPPPGARGPSSVFRPDLREFECEPFYAPLSSYSAQPPQNGSSALVLDRKQAELLAEFRTGRETLLAELRAKIAALENAGPQERLEAFEAFARVQTPPIAALEKIAEELRESLARGADWNALREWKLGRGDLKPREKTRSLEQQVVRAAAYYQEGLSPAQRRLARELAMEMEETVFAKDDEVPTSHFFAFFLPDTARIGLSPDIPAPVRAQLEVFTKEKNALKTELGDAIYEADGAVFSSSRVSDLAALARVQEPRIAALEDIAESIRRDLAHAPGYTHTRPPVELPPALRARIDALVERQRRIDAERLAVFRAAVQADKARIRDALATGGVLEIDAENRRADMAGRAATLRETLARFDDAHAGELAAIAKERDEISDELAGALGSEDIHRISVDVTSPEFLGEFLREQKLAAAYHEYDIAALEPGLSPEQRRLLFGAAISALDLPQPGPERQPTRAPGTIVR